MHSTPWYLSITIHLPIEEELYKMWPLMQNLSSPQFPPILFLCCAFSIWQMQWPLYLLVLCLRLINFQIHAKNYHYNFSLLRSWHDVFCSLSTKNFAILSEVSSVWSFSELHHRPTVQGQQLQKCFFFNSSQCFLSCPVPCTQVIQISCVKI